uniref:Uncharacterized protein n=1 Tax=Anguilla anguilla TaxID=7936 RepID=A0A0E9R421_ANGAN
MLSCAHYAKATIVSRSRFPSIYPMKVGKFFDALSLVTHLKSGRRESLVAARNHVFRISGSQRAPKKQTNRFPG